MNIYNNRPNNIIKYSPKKFINKSKINQNLNINDNKNIYKKNKYNKDKNMYKSNNFIYPTNIKSMNLNNYKNNIIDKNKKGIIRNTNFSYINGKSINNNKKSIIQNKKTNKAHLNRSADNNNKKNQKPQIQNAIASNSNFYYNYSLAQKYLKQKVHERNNNNKFINPRLFNYNYNKDNRINCNYNIM